MANKPLKSRTVAVKVEAELADFLARLPNKSEFIRQAILAQFGTACPLCLGAGQVASALGAHYSPILEKHREKACQKCRKIESIPKDLMGAEPGDRPRWEQFLHGGPYFCAKCFAAAKACGECGWHLTQEQLAGHSRESH
ncbi:MAG: hypothetical protein EXS09_22155 [Gemmataceae bacterium]|nr:hypothetical protein [Gemmataceae bacterium]